MPALGIHVNLEDPDCQESTRPEGSNPLTAPADGGTVRLLSTTEVPTCLVMAEVAKPERGSAPVLVEPVEYAEDLEELAVETVLVIPSKEGVITLPVYNRRGIPLQVKSGQVMGQAQPVEVTKGSSTTAEQRDVSANVNLLSGVIAGLTEEWQ